MSNVQELTFSQTLQSQQSLQANVLFTEAIAVILKNKELHVSQGFFEQILDLASLYIDELLVQLLDHATIQRRRKPALSDLKMLLEFNRINPTDLFDELVASKGINKARDNTKSNRSQKEANKHTHEESVNGENDDIEPLSLPFFQNEQYAISKLVPNMTKKPSYIPSFLPDFPPDYTYQSSATYTKPLSDMKELRIRLVEESRLTEKSLYKLIENDEVEQMSKRNFEQEIQKLMDLQATTVAKKDVDDGKKQGEETLLKQETGGDIELSSTSVNGEHQNEHHNEHQNEHQNENEIGVEHSDFKFDFIKYAQLRKSILEKRQKKLEEKRQLREQNIFIKAERYYGPYAIEKPTRETNLLFKHELETSFKKVVASLRFDERMREEESKKLLELKEKQEREAREQNEIKFDFSTRRNHDAFDSDSDSDDNSALFDHPMEEASPSQQDLVA